MEEHNETYWRRVLRVQRCRCGEFPQAHYHTGRGAVWFSCVACGKIGPESQDIMLAISRWNSYNNRGE